jgi:hypothetical protein
MELQYMARPITTEKIEKKSHDEIKRRNISPYFENCPERKNPFKLINFCSRRGEGKEVQKQTISLKGRLTIITFGKEGVFT